MKETCGVSNDYDSSMQMDLSTLDNIEEVLANISIALRSIKESTAAAYEGSIAVSGFQCYYFNMLALMQSHDNVQQLFHLGKHHPILRSSTQTSSTILLGLLCKNTFVCLVSIMSI